MSVLDMDTQPLYQTYLLTRPDGFQPTLDVPYFEVEEPGTRAYGSKPSIFKPGARVENITPRVGTEVRGVQISQLSKAGLDEVALLAAERGVIVFVSFKSNVDRRRRVRRQKLTFQVERPRLRGHWF